RLWGNDYNASNKHGASTLPSGGGDSRLIVEYGRDEGPIGAYDAPSKNGFITDNERGRWNHFRWHSKMASSSSSNDGVVEVWWNGTLVARDTSMDIYGSGRNYIDQGYLLGWANSGFASKTSIFIDDVRFYDTDPGWN